MGLARLIALVIGLFAKLIGLGGLSKKVTAIFKKIRKRVNRAVMKLLTKAKKKGRQLMRKLGIGKKNQKGKDNSSNEKLNLTSITRSVPTKTDGTHVLLVKKKGNDYQLKIRSKETFYESFITSLEDTNSNQSLKTRALTLARDLDNQFGLADSDKDKVKIEKDLKELSELTIKIVDLSGVKPLQPENIYKGGGKHGIKMQKNDGIMWAKKPTELSPPRAPLPIGKWGNKEDLEYAGKIAATFKDNDIHDVPINAGNNSIVYYHDGTESKPDRIRIRKNKNNKFFHGFPIDSRTAGKIF